MSARLSTWKFSLQATDSTGLREEHYGLVDAADESAARQGVIDAVQSNGFKPCTPVKLKRK